MSNHRTDGSDYDAVSYPPGAYRQTHPERLAVIGALHGLPTPDPGACRVLEIGCGDGSNLIPMAVSLPGSTFLGVDLAEEPIRRGQALIAAAGRKNIRLESMDLLEFPVDAGEFDYIVAHGFVSWIPDFVRRKWWEVVSAHLAPNGIAYASYNAYPAGHLREAVRDAMQFHLARQGTPLADRAGAGRALVDTLAGAAKGDPVWKSMLEFESKRLAKKRLEVIHHDEIGACYAPFHFADIAAEAMGAGLQYVAEASLRRPFTAPDPELERAVAAFGAGDIIAREQYLDFLEFRSFRETVFCRSGLELDRSRRPGAIGGMWVASALRKEPGGAKGVAKFRDRRTDGVIQSNNPVVIGLLERLEAVWPAALPAGEWVEKAGGAIEQLVAAGLAELRMHPLVPARRSDVVPVASPLARVQLAAGTRTTNLLHSIVELEAPLARQVVCRLDGSLSTRELAQLCAGVSGGVAAVLEPLYRHGLLQYSQ